MKKKRGYQQIYERYSLDNIDQILLRQLTEYPETTIAELATLIGYSDTGTRKRLAKPSFQKAIAEVQQTTDQALKGLAFYAIRKVRKLIDSLDDRVALEACKLALNQYANRTESESTATEIIYKVRFGENGQIISDREEIHEGPKNTLELLNRQT